MFLPRIPWQRNTTQADELHGWRELRLSTYLERETTLARGPVWSANYLLLLSMAVQGFGWCALPCALVDEFAAAKSLVQLNVPGWPRDRHRSAVEQTIPPGVAGSWLRICRMHANPVTKLTFLNNCVIADNNPLLSSCHLTQRS
jgi:DNA-binding transcriptional LysR family regulator